jgi:hypothetical protein
LRRISIARWEKSSSQRVARYWHPTGLFSSVNGLIVNSSVRLLGNREVVPVRAIGKGAVVSTYLLRELKFLAGVPVMISIPITVSKHRKNGCPRCVGRTLNEIIVDNDALDHLYPRIARMEDRILKK